MFVWEKLGKIFNPRDHGTGDWMNEFAQAPCVLEFSNFIRIYFSCRPAADSTGQYVSYSAFADFSRDGAFQNFKCGRQADF